MKTREALQLYMLTKGIALHLNQTCKKTTAIQMWVDMHTQDHRTYEQEDGMAMTSCWFQNVDSVEHSSNTPRELSMVCYH